MKTEKTLPEFINTAAKEYALSVLQDRAIPSIIDGLKPVQRLLLYSTIQNAKTKFTKVAAVAGRLSEYGYEHAESSAADAGCLMANTWSNNFPLLDGDGSFGSRLVQKAAATRYIFCKLHDNFDKIFKDIELCPESKNKDYFPPEYYLPIIPFVLLNGVQGIAKGFATTILPHDFKSVTEKCIEYLDTKDIKENPIVKFPDFTGTIISYEKNVKDKTIKGVILEGTYELKGSTKLTITEVPYKYDRESYVTILDSLIDNGIILDYIDECKKEFKFSVSLKRDFFNNIPNDKKHEHIISTFKLQESIGQNITVIGPSNEVDSEIDIVPVLVFSDTKDLIKAFVDLRLPFYQIRIDETLKKLNHKLRFAKAKVLFILGIINETIVLKNQTKKATIDMLNKNSDFTEFTTELLAMNISSMTTDEVESLKKQQEEIEKEINYYMSTNMKKEYLKDLKALLKL